MHGTKFAFILAIGTFATGTFAADYTVNDGDSLDAAISAAKRGDNIYVGPGTYTTSTQYGPNILGNLIGVGETRDDVIIQSSGSYRTLRLADGGRIEKVTIIGEGTYKADKGGAVEVNGGMITNCVITGGTAYGNDSKNAGGNLYVNANGALIVDCVITGGKTKNRGGNVCLDHGTVRNCTISGGSIPEKKDSNAEQFGGNVFMYQGNLENCTVTGGSSERAGNVYVYNSVSVVKDCTIADGTVSNYGGNLFMRDGTLINCLVTNGTCNASGGNVYIQAGSIKDCQMGGGTTKDNEGGSVYMTGGTIDGLFAVCNGSVKGSGGCVWMNNGTLKNSHLVGGTATGYYGGTLYMDGGTAQDTVLEGGVSSREGGNLYMNKGTATRLTISGGKATNDGGNVRLKAGSLSDSTITDGAIGTGSQKKGANVYMDGSSTLSRCTLKGGASENDYDGGSLCVYSGTAVVEDCLVAESSIGGILLGTASKVYSSTVVNNNRYGIWSWHKGHTIYNSVIFGNVRDGETREWWGDLPVNDGAALDHCAASDGAVTDARFSLVSVSASDFVDYANGDYRPARTSALVDVGMNDPRGEAASTLDCAGKPRLMGTIDIGAYEYQPSGLTVSIESVTKDHVYAPATFTFTHASANSASPENVKFVYDFGDGTVSAPTAELTIQHVYTTPGVYTVKITALNDCEEEEADQTYADYVRTTSSKVYVTPGNPNAAFPYDTPATGYATLADAVKEALDDYVISLEEGTYEVAGQIDLNKAITLRGVAGNPEKVVLRNTVETADGYKYRVLQVGTGARVENLTIENGRVRNQYGGNVRVHAGGVVSNCVIRAGRVTADNGNAAGAGVCIAGSGSIVTHCVITGNICDGTSNDKNYAGGAVFVEYGSQAGRLSNCLIAQNTYVTSGEDVKAGTAGVRFGGGNDRTAIENCTIAGNTVEGQVTDDSAGLYCTSWHALVRNCAIAGNYETGKAKCTSVKLDFSSGSGFSYLNNLTDDALIQESGDKSKGNILAANLAAVFRNAATGDYRPKIAGALVDKGTATLALAPGVDLSGSTRVAFDVIDIGCYECALRAGFVITFR